MEQQPDTVSLSNHGAEMAREAVRRILSRRDTPHELRIAFYKTLAELDTVLEGDPHARRVQAEAFVDH